MQAAGLTILKQINEKAAAALIVLRVLYNVLVGSRPHQKHPWTTHTLLDERRGVNR